MVRMSQLAGFDQVIGFDMGGTSTDVSHYAGEYERVFDTQVAGVRLRAPMLDIHTVAAGGGSILHFDGTPLPRRPGLGRRRPRARLLPPRRTADRHRRQRDARPDPARALPAGVRPRRRPAAGRRRRARARSPSWPREIARRTGDDRAPGAGRRGLPATSRWPNMANAVKQISVQRGHDVTRYALTTFGGAGGQHACAVADALGIGTVLVPPMAGVLSALRHRPGRHHRHARAVRRGRTRRGDRDAGVRDAARRPGGAHAAPNSRAEGVPDTASATRAGSTCATTGTDAGLPVELGHRAAMAAAFDGAHRAPLLLPMDRPLVVEAVSVEAAGAAEPPAPPGRGARRRRHRRAAAAATRCGCTPAARWQRRPLLPRAGTAPPGHRRPARRSSPRRTPPPSSTPAGGPPSATAGHLVLHRVRPARRTAAVGTRVDPVMLEVFNSLFMSIAEQMGAAPGEHRPVGQHQGAAGLLLRAVRRRTATWSPTPRTSRSTSARWAQRQGGHPRARGDACGPATSTPSTTRTTAAPTCPTSPSSRRSSTTDGRASILLLRGLPRPPRRDRRHHPRLHARRSAAPSTRRACCSTTGCWCGTAAPRGGDLRLLDRGAATRPATRTTNLADLRAQIAANAEGRRGGARA